MIAACTFIVTLFGYKVVHAYEFYSWIPCFIIFLIVLGEFAHSGQFYNIPLSVGASEIGSALSFGASVFGFATGWTSYAADYTVYQPANSSRTRVFLWTFAGLIFPLCFTEMLGCAVLTASVNNPVFADGYHTNIGAVLAEVLIPPLGGFGKFCLVVLALSIIANNCPNIYSLTFSLQVMGRWTQMVPRFIWTFVGTLVYCAIAIPGYGNFVSVLENFMLLIVGCVPFLYSLFLKAPIGSVTYTQLPPFSNPFPITNQLRPYPPKLIHPPNKNPIPLTQLFKGYWLAIYTSIAITEHFLFKRGIAGYDLTIYQNARLLPPGFAAILAFCFGVFGAVMGMAQVYYTGPIGKLIGDPEFGGDIGFPLAFAFAGISYAILRTLEKRKFGR